MLKKKEKVMTHDIQGDAFIVVIVVPIYKRTMTHLEWISYKQLINVLGTFEIVIIAPENLEVPEEIIKGGLRIEFFSKEFFQSVNSYNKLMLSELFYRRFIQYQYILIYQLDAFVFKNELLYFCNLAYDYIGAPWLLGLYSYILLKRRILYVGNGGFSLRRTQACIDALNRNKDLLQEGMAEDVFFSVCDGRNFRVAPKKIALSFAFEREVERCYEENYYSLPFGCHGLGKYNLQFWRKFIEEFGYKLEAQEITNGARDCKGYIWEKQSVELLKNADLFYGIPNKLMNLIHADEGGYYLWGASKTGRAVKSMFQDLAIPIAGFVDSNRDKQGHFIDGCMVFSPEEMKEKRGIIVTTRTNWYSEVKQLLNELNMTYLEHYIFYADLLPEMK